MLKNSNMQEAYFGAKVFYFSMTFIILIIIITYHTPLSDDIKNGSLLTGILFLILLTISTFSYLTAGTNPGYALINEV
jgi:hypothetical protein